MVADSPDVPPDTEETRYWLALLRTPGLGSRTIHQLLERLPTPSLLFDNSPGLLNSLNLGKKTLSYLRAPDWPPVEADLAWLEGSEANHLITCRDKRYPELLREIPDPPAALFLHGDPSVLQRPQLAVVGSRNPSSSGERTAREFAACLAGAGITITSGLAVGIDRAAHEGALDADGTTIAVTGTGLDRVYPAENKALARRIAHSGALVSEFPPGTPARPGHFPRRNRIISGLGFGTLVVEAALKSGSLITAGQAAEQGREVFAIPGSIHNPLARGCHALIRQGAKLVETAQDVVEELGSIIGSLTAPEQNEVPESSPEARAVLDPDYRQLLNSMGFDPVPVDRIIQQSGLTAEAVSSMLLLLELEGYVSSAPGGRYSRTGKS